MRVNFRAWPTLAWPGPPGTGLEPFATAVARLGLAHAEPSVPWAAVGQSRAPQAPVAQARASWSPLTGKAGTIRGASR
jgi:hypothetical protein